MGELGTELYILKSGEVLVFVHRADGKGIKEIARLRKGNFFGEMAVLHGDGARRGANVKSVAYSIIYSMSNKDLLPLMERFPPLKAAIQRTVATREAELAAAQTAAPPPAAPTTAVVPCAATATATAKAAPPVQSAGALPADGVARLGAMEAQLGRLEASVGQMTAAMDAQGAKLDTLAAAVQDAVRAMATR